MTSAEFSLEQIRLEQNLNLSDVAASTRIPVQTLKALETLDLANLPALPYAKGFLKIYLSVLGVKDTDEYISILSQTFGDNRGLDPNDYSKKSLNILWFQLTKKNRILALPLILLLGYVLFLTSQKLWSYKDKLPSFSFPQKNSLAIQEQVETPPSPSINPIAKKLSIFSSRKTNVIIHWKNAKPTALSLAPNEIKHIEYFSPIRLSIEYGAATQIRHQQDYFTVAGKEKGPIELDFK